MMIFISGIASRIGLAPLLLSVAVALALGLTQAAHGAGLRTGMTPMQSASPTLSASVPSPCPPEQLGMTWSSVCRTAGN